MWGICENEKWFSFISYLYLYGWWVDWFGWIAQDHAVFGIDSLQACVCVWHW